MKIAKTKQRVLWICASVLAFLALVSGIVLIRELNTWGFRKALPKSAVVLKEEAREETLLPDYTYHLIARMSEPEFFAYVKKLQLEQQKGNSRTVFVRERGRERVEAWYEAGCLHLHASQQ